MLWTVSDRFGYAGLAAARDTGGFLRHHQGSRLGQILRLGFMQVLGLAGNSGKSASQGKGLRIRRLPIAIHEPLHLGADGFRSTPKIGERRPGKKRRRNSNSKNAASQIEKSGENQGESESRFMGTSNRLGFEIRLQKADS